MTPVTTPLDAGALQSAAITGTSSTLSAQSLLEQIFGPIAVDPLSALSGAGLTGSGGGAAAGGDVLGTLFSYINMGLLTLGALYLSYKTLSAITQTAHEGTFMGQAFHSVWVPIRVVTGVFSLVPVFGGWSLMQVLMLWFGVLGAGLGNMAWQSVATTFTPYNSLVTSTSVGSSFDARFVPEVFKMYACVDAHNAQIARITDAPFVPPQWGVSPPIADPSGAANQIINFGSNGGNNAECGSVAFTGGVAGNYQNNMPSSFFGSSAVQDIGVTTSTARTALQAVATSQFQSLQSTLSTQAQTYVDNVGATMFPAPSTPGTATAAPTTTATTFKPYDPVAINAISVNYRAQLVQNMSAVMQGLDMSSSIKSAMVQSAQQDGFTTAGAWYTTMASMSYAVNSLAEGTGASIRTQAQAPNTASDSIWSAVYSQINAVEQGSQINTTAGGAQTGDSTASSAWKLIMSNVAGDPRFGAILSSPGQAFVNWLITDNSGQPVILRMKNVGDNMVAAATAVITATGAVEGATDGAENSWAKKLAGAATLGVSDTAAGAVAGAIKVWTHYVTFVCQIAMGFFLMASLYLPLIPFIVFMGQVLNWLLNVIEGVAATPFLAFAHFDTNGEGLGQRTHYGYTFMLQSFMRPVMLIFGFVVASKVLEVIGGYFMSVFPMVLANVQMNSLTGFVSILGYTAIFMVICVGLVNSAMSITYILPEAIWRFMGADSSGTVQVGRDTATTAAHSTVAGIATIMGGRGARTGNKEQQAKAQELIGKISGSDE
jgi:conjugal transfer/type IV secretion protein DotA/TraY